MGRSAPEEIQAILDLLFMVKSIKKCYDSRKITGNEEIDRC